MSGCRSATTVHSLGLRAISIAGQAGGGCPGPLLGSGGSVARLVLGLIFDQQLAIDG
jgi:hypothetical protein